MIQKFADHWAALAAIHNGTNVSYIDYFADLTTHGTAPDPACFKNESGKLLHPNVEGARRMGVKLDAVLTPKFGKAALPTDDILSSVGTMAGISGTVSTNNSGTLAIGWTGSGSGGTGGRALAKRIDGSQGVTVNLPDGAGAAASEIVEVTNGPN